MTSITHEAACRVQGCPWPNDYPHVPWCLHIQGVEHWPVQPTHQHWPKKGMGGNNPRSKIVAILCMPCHDRVDNTSKWDNAVSPGFDGQDEYILWDTEIEEGWNRPLISRVLEAAPAEPSGEGP